MKNATGGMRNLALPLLFGVLLTVSPRAWAQYNSNVQGNVTDPSGAVVPDATVTLRNNQLGVTQTTKTNASGFYRITSVPPGSYTVVVDAKGFSHSETTATVTGDSTAGVDVVLQVSSQVQNVTVAEHAAALNPDETRTHLTLANSQLEALPLQNGATYTVVQMIPGTTGITEWTTNMPILGNAMQAVETYANGRGFQSNLYMLDGLPVMSDAVWYGEPDLAPNTDMVQEVSAQTHTYSVEYGAASSVQVDVISKSGTNNWHGDGDYRYTSKAFSAIPTFTSKLLPFRYDWITGSLGGPIKKDRTFAFFSIENEDVLQSSSSLTQFMDPQLLAWAQQNFPNSINLTHTFDKFFTTPASWVYQSVDHRAQDSIPPAVAGKVVNGGVNCGTASAFNIPCSLPIDDNGFFNQSPYERGTQFSFRLDQYFRGGQDRFYGQYMQSHQDSNAVLVVPQFTTYSPTITHYESFNWTHTFSPTLLNQASFGHMRVHYMFGGGVGGANTIPYTMTICCTPSLSLNSLFTPNAQLEHFFTGKDSLAWTHGNHNFQFGFQAYRPDYWLNRVGIYSRPQTATWNSTINGVSPSVLNFFEDQAPTTYSLLTLSGSTGKWAGQYYGASMFQMGIYAQDGWKVTPDLYLTLGIRWDDFGNPTPSGLDALPFYPVELGAGTSLQQQVTNAYTKSGTRAFPGALTKNFMPRIGFAYSPKGHKTWSIRGGLGLYEDAINLNQITSSLPTNPPGRLTANFSIFSAVQAFQPNIANIYGTQAGVPPYGFTYPTLPIAGTDSRGAVIEAYNANGSPILYPAALSGVVSNYSPQKSAEYNLTVEHDLGHQIVVGVTYAGSDSWNQIFSSGNLNAYPGELLNGGTNVGLTPEFGAVTLIRTGLRANYNSFIATARQTRGNFTWQGSFTQSRSLQDANGFYDVLPDPYNPNGYYAPSDFDYEQRLSLSGDYNLPMIGKNWYKNVVGGWSLSGMVIAQSGPPFSVTCTASYPTCDFNANSINADFPNEVAGLQHTDFTRHQFESGIFPLGLADFPKPAAGVSEGNEPANTFRGPGYFTVDMGISKVITMPWIHGDTSRLKLTAESYNLLNRVNLGTSNNSQALTVNNTINGNLFGQVTSARQARIIELRARFEF